MHLTRGVMPMNQEAPFSDTRLRPAARARRADSARARSRACCPLIHLLLSRDSEARAFLLHICFWSPVSLRRSSGRVISKHLLSLRGTCTLADFVRGLLAWSPPSTISLLVETSRPLSYGGFSLLF